MSTTEINEAIRDGHELHVIYSGPGGRVEQIEHIQNNLWQVTLASGNSGMECGGNIIDKTPKARQSRRNASERLAHILRP